MDKLDKFMAKYKESFESGKKRQANSEYISLRNRRSNTKDVAERLNLWKRMKKISSVNFRDPNFKRLLYIRYADDFVILITGSHEEAIRIKRHVKDYLLKETGLDLNKEKTLVTSTNKKFEFLGGSCKRTNTSNKVTRIAPGLTKRTVPRMRIDIPLDKLMNNFVKNKFCKGKDLPTARKDLVNLDHNEILAFYNKKISGITEFYNFARNYSALHRFIWLLKASCALTLALKFKLRTTRAAFKKFGPLLTSEDGIELKIPKNLKQRLKFDDNRGDIENIMEGTPK